MKQALIVLAVILVLIALAVGVASMFWSGDAVATSAAQPWPGGLGNLEAVAGRFPAIKGNPASLKLRTLAGTLPKNEALDDFVSREMTRGEMAIGQPPALPDTSPIRELLLKEPVIWARPGGIGEVGDKETSANRVVQMSLARSLIASALSKARTGDSAAWEDLRAVWNLSRSLDPQPQMMTQTAAFSMARMINAVAWKMPLPAPAWLSELQERDYVRRLLEAFKYQAASYWQDGARIFPTKWLANSVEGDRRIAEELFKATGCDVKAPMNDLGVDLSFVWRRAFRFRAEREATANALRVRQGKRIETASRCSDGGWTFDGATLRFSREIPTAPPDKPMPLVLRVKP